MKVVWTKRALHQLHEIGDSIARDSPEAAERAVRLRLDAGESLQSGPWRGRRVPELEQDDVRELLLGKCRVIYQVRPDLIRIVTVVHGAWRPCADARTQTPSPRSAESRATPKAL